MTNKKTSYDISTFYPEPDKKVKYIEGTDYNDTILKSTFTLSLCLELVDNIIQKVGSDLIITINYEIKMLPLILTLLLDDNISYIFIYTYKSKNVQMLINTIILLDVGNKCELRDINTSDIEDSGLLYIGVDERPLQAPKGKREYASILIRNSSSGITLGGKNYDIETVGPFEMFISIKGENNPYTNKKKLKKFIKSQTHPFEDAEYERIPVTLPQKKVSSEESKKKEKSKKKEESSEESKKPTKKKEKSKKREESSEESKKPTKKKEKSKKKEESSEGSKKPTKKKKSSEDGSKKSNKKKGKEESSEEGKKPKKKVINLEDESKKPPEFVLGDMNFFTVRPDHKNIKEKEKLPKKGGWLEEFNGIMTFYVLGAEDLPKPSKNIEKDSNKFKTQLHDYLKQLLELFVEDKGDIDELTRDEFMPIWLQTWTHRTYDIDTNYETFELVGDATLSLGFMSYMCSQDPHLNEAELTSLKSKSCDKNALRQISWELGMDNWLRMGLGAKSTSNTAEDVVEAFCEVLHMIGTAYLEGSNKISYSLGPGIKYLQQFVKFLYGPIIFPRSVYISDAKTMLLQSSEGIIAKIGLGNSIEETTTKGEGGNEHTYTLTLSWSDKAMEFFKDNKNEDFMKHLKGKKIEKHIVTVKAGSKKGTAPKAYMKAIQVLEERGITIDWLNSLKYTSKWKDFDDRVVQKALKKVYKEHGESAKLDFVVPKGLGTNISTTVMLLAIIPDGSRRGKSIILGGGTATDITELKNKVLKEYADG
jgi:flagellar biosynthesis GTPase FlhF